MLDTIRNYLRTQTTPEHLSALETSDRILSLFGFKQFDLPFMEILARLEDLAIDHATCVELIDGKYKDYLYAILDSHYLSVDVENLNLEELNTILMALKDCQSLESATEVFRILESSEDDLSRFCQILSLACAYEAEWFMVRLEYVHPNTLSLLHDLYETQASAEAIEAPIVNASTYRENMIQYLAFLGVEDINLTRFVRDGLQWGLAFIDYVKLLQTQLLVIPEKNIAVELFACTLICNDTEPKITLIDSVLAQFSADTEQSARIRKYAQALENKFAHFLTEQAQANASEE